jgi:hypothetical protein
VGDAVSLHYGRQLGTRFLDLPNYKDFKRYLAPLSPARGSSLRNSLI